MDGNDIIGLIITGALGLLLVILGVLLLTGRGSFFIAGFNTMPKSKKEKYDSKALCKFMGKIILPIGLLTPSISIGGIYSIAWITIAYCLAVFGIIIFAAIYANTGNRFKK